MSKIRDCFDRSGSALFGGVGGGGSNSEKLEKLGIYNLRVGDRILMNFDI